VPIVLAIDGDAHIDRSGLPVGRDDAVGHVERLVDEAEAGRFLEADAAVLLALMAGDERMQRRIEVGRGGGHVMHLPVGDHHRAGDAGVRNVAEGVLQRGEQARLGAVAGGGIVAAGLDHAHVELAEAGEAFLHAGQCGVGLPLALADRLALAAVDHQGDDAFQGLALLVEQDGVEEGGGKRRQRRKSQERAAPAHPQAGQRQQRQRHQHGCQQRP